MPNDDNVVGLCERLRVVESSESSRKPSEWLTFWNRNPDGPGAADLIEQQAAEIERLREVLGELIDYAEQCMGRLDYHDCCMMGDEPIKEARAVLKGED